MVENINAQLKSYCQTLKRMKPLENHLLLKMVDEKYFYTTSYFVRVSFYICCKIKLDSRKQHRVGMKINI